jgi:hypothetical protein
MNSAQHFKTIGTRNRRYPYIKSPETKELSVHVKLINPKLTLTHVEESNLLHHNLFYKTHYNSTFILVFEAATCQEVSK